MIIDIYYRHLTNQNVNISEYVYLYTYSNFEGFEISGLLNERYKEDWTKLKNLIDELEEIIKSDIFVRHSGKVLQLYHINK